MTDRKIINSIERARRENNRLWMNLLRLALTHAPKEARATLKKINAKDREISRLLRKLSS